MPFIVITGNPRVESAVALIKGGAADYITKPFDLNEILLKVRQVLTDAKMKRQDAYVGTVFGMRLSRIGDYRIDSVLGEGASGIVFRATKEGDVDSGQWVVKALKLPGESNGQARETAMVRFENEAQIGQAIEHAGIVPIVDHGITGNGAIPYLVMAYVEGKRLDQLMDVGCIAPQAGV